MLVTLGSGVSISAGASQTFQYACNSVQEVYVRSEESGAGTASDFFVTVQIGNEVVVNDISFHSIGYLAEITGGGSITDTNLSFKIDLGSHILDGEENLYVTLRNADASGALNALDVSATVNEGGVYQPLRYTYYADSVFTDTNTLAIYAVSTNDLTEDSSVFTVRNQSYSTAPQVLSGVNVTMNNSWTTSINSGNAYTFIATMAKNQVPMNTSVNYSQALVNGVICISAMDRKPSKARASAQAGQAVLSSMTSAERKAL